MTSGKYFLKSISPVENCMILGDFNAEILPKHFFNQYIDLYWSAISKESSSLSLLIAWGQRVHWLGSAASRFHCVYIFGHQGAARHRDSILYVAQQGDAFGGRPLFKIHTRGRSGIPGTHFKSKINRKKYQ